MNLKNKWTLLLALLTALILTTLSNAADPSASPRPLRAVLLFEESADPEQLETLISETDHVTFLCRYETFFTGAAVETDAETLTQLSQLDGVSAVGLAEYYDCASTADSSDAFTSEECLAKMNADTAWEEGHTGDGTVIAILDSGCNVTHEVFADASLVENPALSEADIEDFAKKGNTKGAYISSRIPFAYDYYSLDTDVSSTNSHGTHVTALAAGYADGGKTFLGAAPGAQILAMKIFPDGSGGGTDDTIILRALEDAWNLGADVVNLSVGTGAGFSGSDTMNGLYCRAYRQMAESGVIICCAAGNSAANVYAKTWSKPLAASSYTDYGSVCSPGSFYGVIGIAAANQGVRAPVSVAEYSSWGPASNLHLDPALTAFGGPVDSAASGSANHYRMDEGTSMASPYAAGMMAVMLQAVRESGVTDRQEASALAQQLVESHAQLLPDRSNGLPVSPRRQGVGLVDLEDALAGTLVVSNPLAELGSNTDGKFTLPVILKNISDQSIKVSLDIQVLTDDYTTQDGTVYSLMAPKDITSGVTVSGTRSLTVPAHGTAAADLELSVSSKLKEELDQVYPNGFYVEGYVTASAGSQSAHGAFLGYCGDWNAAPVLEGTDFRDIINAAYQLDGGRTVFTDRKSLPDDLDRCLDAAKAGLGANLAFLAENNVMRPENGALLGYNGHMNAPADDARSAMPSQDTSAQAAEGNILCLDIYTQRNAAAAVMLVSDQKTGEVYYAEEVPLLGKSDQSTSQKINNSYTFAWDGTDAGENPLPSGTKVQVTVCAWLDSDASMQAAYDSNMHGKTPSSYAWMLEDAYEKYHELTFPVTLDGAPPTAEASLDGKSLSLRIRDDQYTAYAAVQTAAGNILAKNAFAPETPGEICELSADLSGGALPDKLYIRLEDYASNTICYELDVKALAGGSENAMTPCAAALLKDVSLGEWYHGAIDYVVDRGVMEADSDLMFQPDQTASRWDIVAAIYRANGRPQTALTVDELPLNDVSSHAKYAKELCWAYENGIVSGRTDGAFYGTAGVTRQELALMLYRCAKLNGKDSAEGSFSSFPDAGKVEAWAADAMRWAVGAGLIKGNASGMLAPGDGVTRAETAQILMRFINME